MLVMTLMTLPISALDSPQLAHRGVSRAGHLHGRLSDPCGLAGVLGDLAALFNT